MNARTPALLIATAAACVPLASTAAAKPTAARVGDTVTVSAHDLKPGRYSLTLVADDRPTKRSACVARLTGRRRATAGSVRLRAEIPRRLTCWENNKVKLGTVKVTPGAYHLVVGVPDGPSGFDVDHSLFRRALRVKR